MNRAINTPIKDQQTVTPEGKPVKELIAGVMIKHIIVHEDERGELCEVYNPAWDIHDSPLVYVYQAMIRPKKAKGWIVHHKQDDRLFVSLGTLRFALYDDRANSPTYQQLNIFTISDRNRSLIVIPSGVYHALQNVGEDDAYYVNMPTRPYNHADPDKYRLPLKNDLIPFSFEEELGW